MALSSLGLAHAGFENVSDGHVLEIPGPGTGWESEFSVTEPELPIAGMESDVEHQMSAIQSPGIGFQVEPAAFAKVESQAVASGCARQVRRYAQPDGTRHAFSFQQNLFPAHWMLFSKDGSGKLGTAGETEGIHVVLTSSDLNGDSSSCSEASEAAAIIVAPDESSNCNVASTVGDESVQFFKNWFGAILV